MSHLKLSLIKLFGLLSIILVLQSCEPEKPGTYANSKISEGKRTDFHKMNDQLFAAIKDNKLNDVETMMSKELLDNPNYKRTVELIGYQSKAGGYDLMDEYYINNVSPKHQTSNLIHLISQGTDKYSMTFQSRDEETYVALLVPKGTVDKWVITAIYDKYDYGWKLSNLELGQYTANGKNCPQLYTYAKQKFGKGYFVDAVNDMELATKCARPNNEWRYEKEEEIYKFYGQALNLVNARYQFPVTITQVASKPQIFRVLTQTMPEGGIYPMIYYLSKINLKDTTALKAENEAVKKAIGKVLPGIDQDKKYVLFSAFNQRPGSGKSVASYDMTYKIQ